MYLAFVLSFNYVYVIMFCKYFSERWERISARISNTCPREAELKVGETTYITTHVCWWKNLHGVLSRFCWRAKTKFVLISLKLKIETIAH